HVQTLKTGSATVTVSPAGLDHFTVTNSSDASIGTQSDGVCFTVKSSARDLYGNLVTGFTGTVDVSSNKTCSAGCVQSAAFSAGEIGRASCRERVYSSGAAVAVERHNGTVGNDTSGQCNSLRRHDSVLDRIH